MGETMHLKPCLPHDWPRLTITLNLGDARYMIEIERAMPGVSPACELDGASLAASGGAIIWTIAPGTHTIRLSI